MIEILFLLSGYLQQRFLLESYSNNDIFEMYFRVVFGVILTSILAITLFTSQLIQTLIVIQGIGMLYRVHEILRKIEKEK